MNNKMFNRDKLILIGAALLLVVFFSSCHADNSVIKEIVDQKETPAVVVYNSEMLYTEMGHLKMKMFAPLTKYYQFADEPYTDFEEGIEVISYDDMLKVESKITAKFAQYFEKKDLWLARNNVVAQNHKGEVLYTEELYWDRTKRIIYTDVNVRIKTENGNVYGRGLISDDSFVNWEVKEPYDGEIEIKNQ